KGGVANGFFVDAYFRPKDWADATLVARYQNLASNFMTGRQGWTLGAKFRLPYDFGLDLNYAFGPDLPSRANGGGWEIGLRRTYSF
ncbi:hypothetical protein C1Y26_34935, partial [Pseudomonas sp. MPR-R2A7]|uniref:hypothetical protein n=1 Tax=Pseudomonas sp. MPR-R2A7 TaxID=2070618 RepID=UPI000CBFB774